jgi:hypothetical protein
MSLPLDSTPLPFMIYFGNQYFGMARAFTDPLVCAVEICPCLTRSVFVCVLGLIRSLTRMPPCSTQNRLNMLPTVHSNVSKLSSISRSSALRVLVVSGTVERVRTCLGLVYLDNLCFLLHPAFSGIDEHRYGDDGMRSSLLHIDASGSRRR